MVLFLTDMKKGCFFYKQVTAISTPSKRKRSGALNVNFWKISVRKTIGELEFSEHLL